MKKFIEIIFGFALSLLVMLSVISLLKIADSSLPIWVENIVIICSYVVCFGLSRALFKFLNAT